MGEGILKMNKINKKGLSKGAIIAIVVIVVLLLILAFAFMGGDATDSGNEDDGSSDSGEYNSIESDDELFDEMQETTNYLE